jgi:hypothetical protein
MNREFELSMLVEGLIEGYDEIPDVEIKIRAADDVGYDLVITPDGDFEISGKGITLSGMELYYLWTLMGLVLSTYAKGVPDLRQVNPVMHHIVNHNPPEP